MSRLTNKFVDINKMADLSPESIEKEHKRQLNNQSKQNRYANDPIYRKAHIERVLIARSKKKALKINPIFRIETRNKEGQLETVFERIQSKVKKPDLLCNE